MDSGASAGSFALCCEERYDLGVGGPKKWLRL